MSLRVLLTAAAMMASAAVAMPVSAAPGKGNTVSDLFLGAWQFYRNAFVSSDGRIIDNANGNISHSEGQGYGMLLAVAADDQRAFDQVWQWTRDNLMVREDALAAWRWEPNADPQVADLNNASDGDLLIAWALLRAYRQWSDPAYFAAAREIATTLGQKAVEDVAGWSYLLPGVDGFITESDELTVNLSYWVFPALEELQVFAPQFPADRLMDSGFKLAREGRFGAADLPADWTRVSETGFKPAEDFPSTFGYNAIRVPLYLSWYSGDARALLAPYADLWNRAPEPSVIDLTSGKPIDRMYDPGYLAIAALVACSQGHPPTFDAGTMLEMVRYYPSTLSMLSLLAIGERYPECLDAP